MSIIGFKSREHLSLKTCAIVLSVLLIVSIFPGATEASGVQSFTSSGTFTVPADVTRIDVLVVAGGGGGGRENFSSGTGGGGGGGGVVLRQNVSVTPGASITVTVGAGGAGYTGGGSQGSNGSDSSISGTGLTTITATGGGGGGGNPAVGLSGASGGGGGNGSSAGGSGTAGQGYAGGTGSTGGGPAGSGAGGGGGGAGGAGANATTAHGGVGGIGVASSISGSSVYYGGGGSGGGGGTAGPSGGGGTGCNYGSTDGTAGTANTGGGGGGSCNTAPTSAHAGGSGIVIIKYFYAGEHDAVTLSNDVLITGTSNVVGSLSKGSGTFVIDHPLDPANKLLYHSFVESPDVKNLYDGIATLDKNGEVIIPLPMYFLALNKDFRYLATPIGQSMPNLHLGKEVGRKWFNLFGAIQFKVTGGVPNGRISWQITGIRHDKFILDHPITPEVIKDATTPVPKGQYISPELYGK